MVEGARLESVYRLIPYPGFESPSLRQKQIKAPMTGLFLCVLPTFLPTWQVATSHAFQAGSTSAFLRFGLSSHRWHSSVRSARLLH